MGFVPVKIRKTKCDFLSHLVGEISYIFANFFFKFKETPKYEVVYITLILSPK